MIWRRSKMGILREITVISPVLSTDAAPVIAEYLKEHPDKSYYGDGIYNWKWEYMQENGQDEPACDAPDI